MNNQIKLGLATAALFGAGVLGTTVASAQEVAQTLNPMNSLVEKIAQKFGLNQADVQSVFDEARTEHQAQRQAQHEERLNQLVTDGKITETQKQPILAKHQEIQDEREANSAAFKALTPEERREQMQEKRTELQAWAEQNGIDTTYLMGALGKGRGHHPGMFGMRANQE